MYIKSRQIVSVHPMSLCSKQVEAESIQRAIFNLLKTLARIAPPPLHPLPTGGTVIKLYSTWDADDWSILIFPAKIKTELQTRAKMQLFDYI